MSSWQEYLAVNRPRFIDEMLEFFRIPSVSSLPEHAGDVRRAGEWVANRMRQAGIEHVQILETGGHPVVYGDLLHTPGAPTVLIYGHFDTQPVDPEALWTNPPFMPVIDGDRIYARGATDDKGNMLVPILATEALLQSEGKLPLNVKYFFEGQEEIGSPQLPGFVERYKDLLACDVVVSSDGGQWSEEQPELALGARGLCALQIDVVGPQMDLHSGMFGGTVANPIHALVAILASMRSPEGKILVEGFYDDVHVLTPDEKAKIAAVPFDAVQEMARLGIDTLYGEPGYSPLEQRWVRPTLEINGIWGGFQAEGIKTVLPSEAHAKITCRLAPDQDPTQVADRVAAHVQKATPPGVKVNIRRFENSAVPYLMPADHPGNAAARRVHLRLYGKEPFYVRSGGSIPVLNMFLTSLGAYTVNFGFGLPDENIHSPNEFWRLSSFDRAQQAYCLLLHELVQPA
ncbi:MAG: dipeptidase [Caldilineaceae bacterium]|nr:dipeptidase [Caldilineaceae bacterium]